MATPDFGTGKTVIVLAIVAGCFAILWPKVFEPMMQAAFTMTKPRIEMSEQACCQIIYENDIDIRFFTELCNTVVHREARTDSAIRSHRKDPSGSFPPGMLDRCRTQMEKLCGPEAAELLVEVVGDHGAAGPYPFHAPMARRPFNASLLEERLKGLTGCLEKHFTDLPKRAVRRVQKPQVLPTHVHQERPLKLNPGVTHPALREKGHPFPALDTQRQIQKGMKPGFVGQGLRPSLGNGGKTKPGSAKTSGPMGLLMPVYTVGIVLFFVYTIIKVVFRKPEDGSRKVVDLHMEPDHRKYVVSEEYENGIKKRPKQRESPGRKISKLDAEIQSRATDILGGDGRQIVFTAIEGIIAEMDQFSDKIAADRIVKFASDAVQEETEDEELVGEVGEDVLEEGEKDDAKEEGETLRRRHVSPQDEESEKSEEDSLLCKILPLSKLAVLGMETQANFQGPDRPKTLIEEIPVGKMRRVLEDASMDGPMSSIVLETPVAAGTRLLVAESESTSRRAETPEDPDDRSIVVTGKMTISLLSEKKPCPEPPCPEEKVREEEEAGHANLEVSRKHVEELASTLIQDIFRNELPKALEELSAAGRDRRRKMFSRRTASGDSVNSRTSSFEYVTADVDPALREKSPTDSDDGLNVSGFDNLPESDPCKVEDDQRWTPKPELRPVPS